MASWDGCGMVRGVPRLLDAGSSWRKTDPAGDACLGFRALLSRFTWEPRD